MTTIEYSCILRGMKNLLIITIMLSPMLLLGSTMLALPGNSLSGEVLWGQINDHFQRIGKLTAHHEYTPVNHEMLAVAVKKVQKINPEKAWYDGFTYDRAVWDCDMQALAVLGVFKAFYYDLKPAIGFMMFKNENLHHAALFYFDDNGDMFLFETTSPGRLKHVPVELGDKPGTIIYKDQVVTVHTLLF